MATFSVTVPDAAVPIVTEALRALHSDLGEGKTDLQLARAVIALTLRAKVQQHAAAKTRQQQQGAIGTAEQEAWQATEGIS